MTKERNDDEVQKDSPFSAWVRKHPELDSTHYGYDFEDVDCIWHQYVEGKIMIIEMKQHNAHPNYAQRDTHSLIDQALTFAFSHSDLRLWRINPKRPTKIQYFGYHLIQFEHTSPEDGEIKMDEILVSKEQFLRFLKFDSTFFQWLKFRKERALDFEPPFDANDPDNDEALFKREMKG